MTLCNTTGCNYPEADCSGSCCTHDCKQGRTCPARKIKPYPAVPADPPPFEYVPTWRDRMPDLARGMLFAAVVALASVAATVVVLGAAK